MESGRIEALRALPVHREAQLTPVGQILTMYIDVFLMETPQTLGFEPYKDVPGWAPQKRHSQGAHGKPPASRPGPAGQEGLHLEVGTEGAALNPNRK